MMKKIIKILMILSVAIMIIAIKSNVVLAKEQNPAIYFGITEKMTYNDPSLGYAIENPNDPQKNAIKLWNFIKCKSSNPGDGIEDVYAYCLKAGIGFSTAAQSGTAEARPYDVYYDMKTEKDLIKAQNNILRDLVEKQITLDDGTQINIYDALLAVIDMMYVPGESEESEKENLINAVLEYAYEPENGYTDGIETMMQYPLTEDDISAVQQAVLWYFTNYEEDGGKYDKTKDKSWLYYTTDGSTYDAFKNYAPNGQRPQYDAGQARSWQAEILYNYMISTAKEKAKNYQINSNQQVPASFKTTQLKYIAQGNNYIIGPIRIEQAQQNTVPFTIELVVKNNDTSISYQLLDDKKQNVDSGKNVNDFVGKDFYISVAKENAKSVSVGMNISYKSKKATLWASNKDTQEQPLVLTESELITVEVPALTVELKEFDLALRKYITKVNDTAIPEDKTRVPSIDKNVLTNGTTASYKHRKDPVQVNTKDRVTYKITIYNEGQKEGRATKVVDQLPSGLKYNQKISGNFEVEDYDETNNTLYLKRKEENKNNLAAYTGGVLSEETIEIECIVEATAEEKDKILTNVAWISEEIDAESGETITNQEGKDRDSEPDNKPNVAKDTMENYTGKEENLKELDNPEKYYEGKQDDDDFEKLILPKAKGFYDLKIIKVDSEHTETKLSGAIFKVTLADEKVENMTIPVSGEGLIQQIPITQAGKETITIEETTEPKGYFKLLDKIQLEVTKVLQNGEYKANNIEIKSTQQTGKGEGTASASVQDGVITVTIPNRKKIFDLALRKYITKVNDTAIPEDKTRVPSIDKNALANGTTASYKHRKDPVQVKTKDRVTYKLTIYNEGEKEGRATKIVDQLPSGLKYNKKITGNFEVENYDETNNTLYLKRKEENNNNLAAYKGGVLAEETIEIECIVEATAGEEDNILTNVAWISEEVDAELGETITNDKGKDRDSEPGNKPDVTKDTMENYTGKEENLQELNNPEEFYEGKQDDDDFEKLILPKATGKYSLKIIKVDAEHTDTKLNGAVFKVTLPNKEVETLTTTGQGEAEIPEIEITASGKEIIKIEETTEPNGYFKLLNSVELEVTKILDKGEYKASNIELKNAQQTGKGEGRVSANIEDGVITLIVPNKKKVFDLALRKYITQVEGEDLPVAEKRIPDIDKNSLAEGTTATYKHRKDPVRVETGNKVTYKITIYNEGEKAGRATKIVDQLPRGLRYNRIISGKFTVDNYDTENNTLNLKRTDSENLAAYEGEELAEETIEIECIVDAIAGEEDEILTNVAWIEEEVDAVTGETITSQEGKDRDSEPDSKPSVGQDTMENYTGKEENLQELNNPEEFYEGKQDDDDFEKLILPKATGNYELKIIKIDSQNTNKKLSGAQFKITLANGTEENLTTDTQGLVQVQGIEITASGKETITIEETTEPNGYSKLLDSVELEVTKVLENGKYKASDIELKNPQQSDNVSANIENGVITLTIKNKEKIFDLALRKYITQINGQDLPVDERRIPDIDKNSLAEGTTATYKHRKDLVRVETGNKITYKITIYNEGEKAGRATKIVDQLPTGLRYSQVLSGKFTLDNYDTENNIINLKRIEGNNDNLAAYERGVLSEETIEIECIVDETAGDEDKILTNVAWIAEEVDAVTGETITSQQKRDRDSEPDSKPSVAQDTMENYTGKENKEELDDSENYYKGQQDDDDFEKLVLPKAKGKYALLIEKVGLQNEGTKLKGADFKVTLADGTIQTLTTNEQGQIEVPEIEITESGKETITIEETKAPEYYKKLIDKITLEVTKEIVDGEYQATDVAIKENDSTKVNANVSNNIVQVQIKNKPLADFKLIKRIVAVNDKDVPNRIESIDASKLNTLDDDGNLITTAEYNLNKEPVEVKKGDIVTYTLRVYNEGLMSGYVQEITEDVPEGLEFLWSEKTEEELQNDASLTQSEKEAIAFNKKYSWKKFVYDEEQQNRIVQISSDYLSKEKETQEGQNSIQAFGENDGSKTEEDLYYKEISVKFKVISDDVSGTVIRNEAAITEDADEEGKEIEDRDSKPDEWKKYEDDEDYDEVVLKSFDLALRKFIIAVSNDTEIQEEEYLKNADSSYTRAPQVDTSKLNTQGEDGELITTATYNHTKEPVVVKRNDYVIYMLRVYNEGETDGYAGEIQDHLPPYLEFVEDEFNTKYGWSVSEDGRTVTTRYLENSIIKKIQENEDGEIELSYQEVPIMCKVAGTAKTEENITNIADITEYLDEDKDKITDRDSEEENVELPEDEDLPGYKDDEEGDYIPGQEDDDDFEKVVVYPFDLALRKFIIAVSNDTNIEEDEYLKNEDNSYIREPQVDTSKLNTQGEDGKVVTTATYNHTKEPVVVKRNDYVIYMLRVYNEAQVDGYAGEIQDYLPPYLEFVKGEFNTKYGWSVSEDGRTVTTRYLENSIIKKIQENEDGEIELSYQEVPIMCKVAGTAKTEENITNIADITEYLDEDKDKITDRDSEEENVELPEDEDLPGYKDDEEGDYIPGQEDDDDFEKVVVYPFDLALRKFITQVDENNVNSRIPQVKYDAENNKLSYEHTKEPVNVATGNIVTYTIRIFNEGALNGYAAQILDDIPDGLEYLPESSTNKEYRWKMYRKLKDNESITSEIGKTVIQDGVTYVQTDNVKEAEVIVTDYLSKEQGELRMQEEDTENPNLLKAFNPNAEISDTNPDYKDVKIAFKVTEPNSSDKIVVNEAQISKDTDEKGEEIDDEDSVPSEWNDGEDDQDKEYVKLLEFDLFLRKWVTQAVVIENGKQTITQTGHQPYDDPEKVVKVELHRKKLNQVTVKFRYSIRVTNEGDIEGYAKEVTDYVPQGLKFVAEDNPGWKDEGNNVISTRLLENTLLKPGEYAEVEVLLTWVNNDNNMGVMENTAEISEDENEYGVPDKDSTPDNKKDGEDDIDDAPVMLSISTGQVRIYFTIGFIVLITIAGGIVLIKKFVL